MEGATARSVVTAARSWISPAALLTPAGPGRSTVEGCGGALVVTWWRNAAGVLVECMGSAGGPVGVRSCHADRLHTPVKIGRGRCLSWSASADLTLGEDYSGNPQPRAPTARLCGGPDLSASSCPHLRREAGTPGHVRGSLDVVDLLDSVVGEAVHRGERVAELDVVRAKCGRIGATCVVVRERASTSSAQRA